MPNPEDRALYSFEQLANIPFEPVDLSSIGLSLPLAGPQWREFWNENRAVRFRCMARTLEMTKGDLQRGFGRPLADGRCLGEELCDIFQTAEEDLVALAELFETAALRVMAAMGAEKLASSTEVVIPFPAATNGTPLAAAASSKRITKRRGPRRPDDRKR